MEVSFFFLPSLQERVFPCDIGILPCLVLLRNLCYLCCCVYHGPHFRVLVGSGDQGKDARGNRILIPLTRHDLGIRSHHVLFESCRRTIQFMDSAAILQPFFAWMYHLQCSYECTFVQYEAIAEGKCVYICIRYDGIVAEGTQPLHGLRRRAIYLLYSSAIICPVQYRAHVRILKQ